MKTSYININNEQIQSNDELEVLNYDLDSDFFFYLGEKIAKGCNVENEIALITDFNTPDTEEDYKQIIAQWNEIKAILFSEECKGKFEFTLPNGYFHWLKFHPQYVAVYDRNFSHGGPTVITIDLGELYEDSIDGLQRKILLKLQRDDLYEEVDKIVFNDDVVTRKSTIVRIIKEKYDGIGFISYNEWLQENAEEKPIIPPSIVWPIDLCDVNVDKIVKLGYTPISVIGHNDVGYIILATKQDKKCVLDISGHFLYDFDYAHAIPTKTGKYAIVKLLSSESRYFGLIKVLDGKELLPCTYCSSDNLNEWEPGFFSNIKFGTYCAVLDMYCDYSDKNIFIDKKNLRIYSKKTWTYIEVEKYLYNIKKEDLLYCSLKVNLISNIYFISFSSYSNDFRFIINKDVDKLFVLQNDENVVDVSDGMIVIMDEDEITQILDENYNNILKKSFITIDNSIKFQDGIAVYQINKKRIGCINKQGEHIEIPWNFGGAISEIEVLIPPFIIVTKTTGEMFVIDTSGESVVDVGRWDNIRKISKTKFEVYNCNNATLYEVKNHKIDKIA